MDTYNVLQKLGKGTYGTVYLCERKHNKLKLVIKEIVGELNDTQLLAGKNEVSVLKNLNHPNIIRYYDSFAKNGSFYIVMEYARHRTLYDLLSTTDHILTREYVLNIFCQILMGLEHIHSKKIIHRDLKTENVFLTGPNVDIVKLGDFGISKILQSHGGKTNTVIGTTNYIAPEICDGQPYDTKTDIWSLGCILYEMCALERLFQGSVAAIVSSIKSQQIKAIDVNMYGQKIQDLISEMLQMAPENRPAAINLLAEPFIVTVTHRITADLGNIFPE